MKRINILLLIVVLLFVGVMPVAAQTTDPRTDNAKAFHTNSAGLVDGVELVYQERPWTTYQIVQARLVDEQSAAGNVVAKFVVVDCNGVPLSENVYLAWAWPELLDGKSLPGNQNNEHMIYTPYNPPDIGPLALYVGDAKGNINSDVIGGLGLPFKRHVSYYVAFKKRCGVNVVTPAPTVRATPSPTPDLDVRTPFPTALVTVSPVITPFPPTKTDLTETNNLLRQIMGLLQQLSRHLGVPGYATP